MVAHGFFLCEGCSCTTEYGALIHDCLVRSKYCPQSPPDASLLTALEYHV